MPVMHMATIIKIVDAQWDTQTQASEPNGGLLKLLPLWRGLAPEAAPAPALAPASRCAFRLGAESESPDSSATSKLQPEERNPEP